MAEMSLYDPESTVKVCNRCGIEKPVSGFHLRKESGKPRRECIECYRAAMSARRDPAENRRRVKEWQKANPDRKRAHGRATYGRSRQTLIGCLRRSFASKRAACRKANIRFELTAEEIAALFEEQGGRCALTGRTMLWGVGGMPADLLSIDRIDHSEGYVAGNVRLITYQANFARNKFSDEDLLRFCADVIRHATKK